jgi:hypothetical protein
MEDSSSGMHAGLTLAEEEGLPVFPCRPDKKPYTPHGLKDASSNIQQIGEWIDQYPDALLAVPTGHQSKLLVVDIDPDGEPWYSEHAVRLACGRVHKTRRGHHLLYRMPDADIRNSAGKIARGVDVRAEGGYVIWWPACGLEVVGDLQDLTEPPKWLLDALLPKTNGHAHPTPAGDKQGTGNRNDTLTKLAGSMRKAGFSTGAIGDALHKENYTRFDPPLPGAEVNAICAQAEKWEQGVVAPTVALATRSPLDWASLEGKSPPTREWALEHWLPQRHPSLMAGRGGIGKTLVAQHLGTAMVFGRPYLDAIVRPLKVLLWAGEDDEAELWRRQIPICQHFEVSLRALKDRLILQSYEGCDITLAAPVFGTLCPTPMLAELTEQVHDYGADYVFLDNIARIYGGNESDRHSVTTFIAWLSAACRPAGLCLLGHPAKGIGSEYSGSTAWEGAVRARLYLSDRLPDAEAPDDEEAPDPGVRYLSRRKSNYSPNDWRRLDYHDGVLVPEDVQPTAIGVIGGEFARDVVRRAVRKLALIGFHGNTSQRSPDYLPKIAKQYGYLDRLNEKRFGAIMRDMVKDGELKAETVGKYSNRSPKSGLVLR